MFAVGFLARPVGAWLMGVYADRAGRKAALVASVALMCLGSLMVAVLPGYATIGQAAPIILTIARLVQGLSVGGEYGASATYMSEVAGKARRGFWSSFQFVTLIGGQLCALGVLILLQHILSKGQLDAWGWRIPFVIGAMLAVVVFWIQKGLEETRSFEAVDHSVKRMSTTWRLISHHPTETAMVFVLSSAGGLSFYCFTTYMQKFLTNTAHFSRDVATQISAVSLLACLEKSCCSIVMENSRRSNRSARNGLGPQSSDGFFGLGSGSAEAVTAPVQGDSTAGLPFFHCPITSRSLAGSASGSTNSENFCQISHPYFS